jgi:O-antigen/teichoic acid export membrane protein
MNLYGRERARRSLLNTVAYRAISQITTLLGYVVLVRALPEEQFGVLNLLYAFIPVVSTFASLGLEQTLRRFQPEYLRHGDTVAAAWLARSVALARLLSNAVIIALVLAAWNAVAPLFHLTAFRDEFALFSLLLLLYFQSRILEFALASHMLHRFGVGSTVLLSVVKLGIYLILVHAHLLTLRAAIYADTAAYAAAYLFLRHAYTRVAKPPADSSTFHVSTVEKRRLWRYAMFNNFNDAGGILLYVQTDNFFIAALLNPLAVAAYSFYTRINAMLSNVTPMRLLETVVQPLFFSVSAADATVRIPRYLTLLVNCSLIVQMPLVAYTVVYHAEIVALISGGKYIDFSYLLPVVVAFGTTSNVIAIPVTCVAQYEERASLIMTSQLFGLYQIVAMMVLIPLLGLLGAVIATGTFHLFRNLFVWWQVRTLARWLNFRSAVVWNALIWGGVSSLCLLLRYTLPMPRIAQMALGAVLCAAAILLHVRTPALAASDRELLGQLFHGREESLLKRFGVLRRTGAA